MAKTVTPKHIVCSILDDLVKLVFPKCTKKIPGKIRLW